MGYGGASQQAMTGDEPVDGGYDAELDGESERAPQDIADNLALIAEYEGNLADLLSDETLRKIGDDVLREYEYDETSRSEWLAAVERALKVARQKPEAKNYPFTRAANLKMPLLTVAAMQFNARCYGAVTRGDQPLLCKVQGEDPHGDKARRARRVRSYGNHQLMYEMDEWDGGTDKLTFMLPVVGSAFRKGYWKADAGRPALEFTSAKDVVVPNDAPSFERAPRLTQPCNYYPYEIDRLVQTKQWREHRRDDRAADGKAIPDTDEQKPVVYLEQQRYLDLDEDGLSEPYIVTVSKDHHEVVRIDAAYWASSIRVGEMGGVETIMRESPWIDYNFLPDIEGSVYGMGFGQLLESLGLAINASVNQLMDAGHRQNTPSGFISQGLRLRGGAVSLKPNEFLNINVPGRVSDAIHELKFEGPSAVMFQLMEFLLGMAQDITSVKDVMTGEAPAGQAMGATLALIEQGMQVFSTMYTRIWRAMRKEFRLLFRLNARYLDPRVYAEFLDDARLFAELNEAHPMMGHNGGPPMGPSIGPNASTFGLRASGLAVPQAPGLVNSDGSPMQGGASPPAAPADGAGAPADPGAPAAPPGDQPPGGQPQPEVTADQLSPDALKALKADFDLSSMDIAPSADPRSVTDMQRMMRAQYLEPFKREPGIDPKEIQRRQFEAADIEDVDKLFLQGPSPMDQIAAEKAKADLENVQLTNDLLRQQVKTEQQRTILTGKQAENTRQDANDKAFGRGTATGMAGGVRGVAGAADDAGVPGFAGGPAGAAPGGMDAPALGVGGQPGDAGDGLGDAGAADPFADPGAGP